MRGAPSIGPIARYGVALPLLGSVSLAFSPATYPANTVKWKVQEMSESAKRDGSKHGIIAWGIEERQSKGDLSIFNHVCRQTGSTSISNVSNHVSRPSKPQNTCWDYHSSTTQVCGECFWAKERGPGPKVLRCSAAGFQRVSADWRACLCRSGTRLLGLWCVLLVRRMTCG